MTKDNVLQEPIIFIGTGRCGSTVLSEIVMRHPHVAFLSNYQKNFPSLPEINLVRHFYDNNFWKLQGQKKQLNPSSIFTRFLFYPVENYNIWKFLTRKEIDFSSDFLVGREADQPEKSFIRNYFSKMIKYQGRQRLVLKITGPSRISYLKSVFPDAVFIHAVRDELSTVKSFVKVPFWKDRGYSKLFWRGAYSQKELDWSEKNKDNPKILTAFQLKKIKQVTDYEKYKLNPKLITVQYEDFLENPSGELSRILEFANLKENSEACFSYLQGLKLYDRNLSESGGFFSREEIDTINNIQLDKL